ncbi:hypothetical protein JTE90_000839 [Oedothorax gibbosus]|uniref:Uncharacterized protein n=1 Tax=Oedothorax gibbosus TaxID=931172 RepID=A0AAV6VUG1_9ARAC|nr:hypothetical protein JTE90_000839 [Oedothorax gibbosus]
MSERRMRARGGEKAGPGRARKAPRSRLGSIGASNEESTEGEEEGVVRKVCNNRVPCYNRLRTERGGHTRKRSSRIVANGLSRLNGLLRSTTADEDVIDGFLFLSFPTVAEMEVRDASLYR